MKILSNGIFLLFFLSILFSSCSPKGSLPAGVLSKEEMSSILLDMELAKAYNHSYYPRNDGDSIYPSKPAERIKVFYQQILQMHHIDTATFFHSFHFYSHHPDRIKKVYEIVKDSIDARLADIKQKTKEKRQRLNPTEKKELYMKFWKEDIKTTHDFYDSIYQQTSKPLYIWKKQKTEGVPPVRIWNNYLWFMHSFYDSIRQEHSIPVDQYSVFSVR